jgi:hypothetical protein
VLGAALLLRIEKPALLLQATLPPPKDRKYAPYFSLSPDGEKIAFVTDATSGARRLLWIRSLDSTAAEGRTVRCGISPDESARLVGTRLS